MGKNSNTPRLHVWQIWYCVKHYLGRDKRRAPLHCFQFLVHSPPVVQKFKSSLHVPCVSCSPFMKPRFFLWVNTSDRVPRIASEQYAGHTRLRSPTEPRTKCTERRQTLTCGPVRHGAPAWSPAIMPSSNLETGPSSTSNRLLHPCEKPVVALPARGGHTSPVPTPHGRCRERAPPACPWPWTPSTKTRSLLRRRPSSQEPLSSVEPIRCSAEHPPVYTTSICDTRTQSRADQHRASFLPRHSSLCKPKIMTWSRIYKTYRFTLRERSILATTGMAIQGLVCGVLDMLFGSRLHVGVVGIPGSSTPI